MFRDFIEAFQWQWQLAAKLHLQAQPKEDARHQEAAAAGKAFESILPVSGKPEEFWLLKAPLKEDAAEKLAERAALKAEPGQGFLTGGKFSSKSLILISWSFQACVLGFLCFIQCSGISLKPSNGNGGWPPNCICRPRKMKKQDIRELPLERLSKGRSFFVFHESKPSFLASRVSFKCFIRIFLFLTSLKNSGFCRHS